MTDTMTMLEKVARAMWEAREQTFPAFTRVPFELTPGTMMMARAALESLRDPTLEMVDAMARSLFGTERGVRQAYGDAVREAFRAAITAALNTGEKP